MRLREGPVESREAGKRAWEKVLARWERTRSVDPLGWRQKVSSANGMPLGSKSKCTVDLLLLLTHIPAYIHSLQGSYLLLWLTLQREVGKAIIFHTDGCPVVMKWLYEKEYYA